MVRLLIAFTLLIVTSQVSADQHPILSLVIDDLGYSLSQGKAAIELRGQHTYAILPTASYSLKLAEIARQQNKEVILHLPMQSINMAVNAEPSALHAAMDENQLSEKVHNLLARIPGIKGVNNHMGSYLTRLDFFMRPVMDIIHSFNQDLYFLDSRTTPGSVAYTQAIEAGLQSTTRDIFLDNEHENPASIRLQLQLWLTRAREHGSAIAIGHPHANTLSVLNEYLEELHDEFRFMPVSRLIELRDESTSIAQR
ncbi:MAG: polysaccharide deacetylase 2 family uncharacterized protein YibQ [Planctomycetota bacterium]|jgi:polysaccharide deacetylase 2 family uncharacterized protein YibQ